MYISSIDGYNGCHSLIKPIEDIDALNEPDSIQALGGKGLILPGGHDLGRKIHRSLADILLA